MEIINVPTGTIYYWSNNKNMNTEFNPLKDVEQFHKLFDHPVLSTPTIPDSMRCELRLSLLTEELKELTDAINDKNIVEIADAFADLQYVLAGAILEFGLGDLFPKVFAEVQRSNMSKACTTVEEAEATIEHYQIKDNCSSHYFEKEIDIDGTLTTIFVVVRDGDLKTLKSINYSPADLSFIKEL